MASKIDVYDIANFGVFHEELGIYNFVNSKLVEELKSLSYETSQPANNRLLDSISYDYYKTELLWWIIGFYNDIIDPMVTNNVSIYLPSLADVEVLLMRHLGSQ